MKPVTNMAASVHQRLMNQAKLQHQPFGELLQHYAIERFLYRLGQSACKDQLILKGAFVFSAWQAPMTRPTRDIDFLGYAENSIDVIAQMVREICVINVEEDGLKFDPETLSASMITEQADYPGVRIRFSGYLGKISIPMRIDIGFADIVTPAPEMMTISPILEGFKGPIIRAYPPETVIAEKFEALVSLGMLNSRMKDFYDLWYIIQLRDFDYQPCHTAITNTFNRRRTALPTETPAAFQPDFSREKQSLWAAFRAKSVLQNAPESLADTIHLLNTFFAPFYRSGSQGISHWTKGQGWQ